MSSTSGGQISTRCPSCGSKSQSTSLLGPSIRNSSSQYLMPSLQFPFSLTIPLPENSFFGLALDRHRHGLLVVVYRLSSPSFSVLASYHLTTFNQLFLAQLPNSTILNNVVVDFRTLTSLMQPMALSSKSTSTARPRFCQDLKPLAIPI